LDHWVIVAGSLGGTAVAKKTSSKGKGKGKDPITGRTLQLTSDGRELEFKDDIIYDLNLGNTAGSDIKALDNSPVSPPLPGRIYTQFQLSKNALVQNDEGYTDPFSGADQHRGVMLGKFLYDKAGRIKDATIKAVAFVNESTTSDEIDAVIMNYANPVRLTFPSPIDIGTGTVVAQYFVNYSSDGERSTGEIGGGLAAIRAFGGGKYFFEGWQNNLFDTSLV
jgi:hypothetical protein